MSGVYEDVFLDDKNEPSEIIESINVENQDPNIESPACILKEDQFMPVEKMMSPCLLLSETKQNSSLNNIYSALTPLSMSTLISDLSPSLLHIPAAQDNGDLSVPSPSKNDNPEIQNNSSSLFLSEQQNTDSKHVSSPNPPSYSDLLPCHQVNDTAVLENDHTPIPSPVNHNHETCNDMFCPTHDSYPTDCPSIGTTASSMPSPLPPTVRCRGKKRLRNQHNWEEVKRKRLKNEGKEYLSKRRIHVSAKTIGRPCTCVYKCSTKISQAEREEAFERFWKLGDREKQWLHVANYTTKQKKKRAIQTVPRHNRQFTYKYYLPKNSTRVEVCKKMFLNTYAISERLVRTAWDKYDGNTAILKDMRGKHNKHVKVITDEMVMSVCAHVNSFAPVESHYNRAASTRLYLDGSLSVARMFILYKEWQELNNYTDKATSLRQYRDIVNAHFNLSFHVPKKDACDQCHSFKQTENPSDQLKEEYARHQKCKVLSRTMKEADKRDAVNSNGNIVSATFDFQKVLSCPHGQMSTLYYKRKLSYYNFTIYNMADKNGYCYVWDESVAKRGANEVASCVYDFIKKNVSKGAKEFRFWSDNCGGQNRNRIVFYMYAHAAREFNITIIHRFLEKGHTQSEGDSVHSVIERAAMHKTIYAPEEWKIHIRWAKVTGDPYEVIDVDQSLVLNFKDHLRNKNWVKNTVNGKVTWSNMKEIYTEGSQPNTIRYKYDLSDDYMTIILRKETRNQSVPIL